MRKGCSGGQTEPSQSSTLISWENSSRQEHICYKKESRKKPMFIKWLLMAWVCDVCVVSFSLHYLASFLFCRYGHWPRVSHGDSLTYDRAQGWTGPKNCSSTHLPYCIMLPNHGRDRQGRLTRHRWPVSHPWLLSLYCFPVMISLDVGM